MKKTLCSILAAVLAGCCTDTIKNVSSFDLCSPDGRNVIKVSLNPLSYEVVRDGRTLVAKTPIGMKINGKCIAKDLKVCNVTKESLSGEVATPVYKKACVDLSANTAFADFGDWGFRVIARNDGVAYRFETEMDGKIRVDCEKADIKIPDSSATCWANMSHAFGWEESVAKTLKAADIKLQGKDKLIYAPFVYQTAGKTVAVTDADVYDYPVWNFVRKDTKLCSDGTVKLDSLFEKWPKKTSRVGGWGEVKNLKKGGRWIRISEYEPYIVETQGTRTFPWRTFILADSPAELCEADIVYAVSTPACKDADFSWVKPGKVAWDWWNAFDNKGDKGCNTKAYFRFIDFAAKTGVEYVILDEGWSESLNIWKFHPNVDVPKIIEYANKKGVGIILWLAWAQAYGEEKKVVEHFAKLGAKGFKVDFMDRSDARVTRFLETFADECAKAKMLVDYHGVYRPVGLHRRFPNVLNYEGVHGLEQTKWFKNGYDFMENDIKVFFLRMTAGPMDYTPGAMDNYPIGKYNPPKNHPGSIGTRCRQMAMMAMYEAPLQMLCDSPTKYENNMESFKFMAATPVVWDETVGLGGDPDSFAAIARRKGGVWYAAAMTNAKARDYELDTKFLGSGEWNAEIFRDAADSDKNPSNYDRITKKIKSGEKILLKMAPGGGFVIRFTK